MAPNTIVMARKRHCFVFNMNINYKGYILVYLLRSNSSPAARTVSGRIGATRAAPWTPWVLGVQLRG